LSPHGCYLVMRSSMRNSQINRYNHISVYIQEFEPCRIIKTERQSRFLFIRRSIYLGAMKRYLSSQTWSKQDYHWKLSERPAFTCLQFSIVWELSHFKLRCFKRIIWKHNRIARCDSAVEKSEVGADGFRGTTPRRMFVKSTNSF
jgi:hypothetical protein